LRCPIYPRISIIPPDPNCRAKLTAMRMREMKDQTNERTDRRVDSLDNQASRLNKKISAYIFKQNIRKILIKTCGFFEIHPRKKNFSFILSAILYFQKTIRCAFGYHISRIALSKWETLRGVSCLRRDQET